MYTNAKGKLHLGTTHPKSGKRGKGGVKETWDFPGHQAICTS